MTIKKRVPIKMICFQTLFVVEINKKCTQFDTFVWPKIDFLRRKSIERICPLFEIDDIDGFVSFQTNINRSAIEQFFLTSLKRNLMRQCRFYLILECNDSSYRSIWSLRKRYTLAYKLNKTNTNLVNVSLIAGVHV